MPQSMPPAPQGSLRCRDKCDRAKTSQSALHLPPQNLNACQARWSAWTNWNKSADCDSRDDPIAQLRSMRRAVPALRQSKSPSSTRQTLSRNHNDQIAQTTSAKLPGSSPCRLDCPECKRRSTAPHAKSHLVAPQSPIQNHYLPVCSDKLAWHWRARSHLRRFDKTDSGRPRAGWHDHYQLLPVQTKIVPHVSH